MSTTATVLSAITGLLFLMAGIPKTLGVPAPMGLRVRTAFERFGVPAPVGVAVGVVEVAFAAGFGLAAATDTPNLAIATAIGGIAVLIGAAAAHLKVKDPIVEYVPVALYVGLCVAVIATAA